MAAEYSAAPHCPVSNIPANHQMGQWGCKPCLEEPESLCRGVGSLPENHGAVVDRCSRICVPSRPNWMGERDGSVAVIGSTAAYSQSLSLRDRQGHWIRCRRVGGSPLTLCISPAIGVRATSRSSSRTWRPQCSD